MSDQRQSTPTQSSEKSNGAIIFIVGGLVVAVGVLAYVFTDGFSGGSMPGAGSAPAISIENNATAPAAAPTAAPAEPAPAPADPAPAPAAPANP